MSVFFLGVLGFHGRAGERHGKRRVICPPAPSPFSIPSCLDPNPNETTKKYPLTAYWCTDGKQLGPDFVMVVTGELPTVASGLYDQPLPAADVVRIASVQRWPGSMLPCRPPRRPFPSTYTPIHHHHHTGGLRRPLLGAAGQRAQLAAALLLEHLGPHDGAALRPRLGPPVPGRGGAEPVSAVLGWCLGGGCGGC